MPTPAMRMAALKEYLPQFVECVLRQKRSGRNSYCCPLCSSGTGPHHTGAFYIFKGRDGVMRWMCHSCGEGGDLVDLIVKKYRVSNVEALRIAERELGIFSDDPAWRPPPPPPQPRKTVSEIAPVYIRNSFYSYILGCLSLDPAHESNLRDRGMPDAEMWQYRSVPDRIYSNTARRKLAGFTQAAIKDLGSEPRGVPGFYIAEGKWTIALPCQGFLIPVRDISGQIQGIQVRSDGNSGRKYRWVSSNPNAQGKTPFICGTCAEACVHFRLVEDARTVYITEGPLKGDIASFLLHRSFLALPGVNAAANLKNALSALRKRGYIRAVNAFDMDRMTNPNVSSAVNAVGVIAADMGFEWRDLVWNPDYEKDGRNKGIDDWAASLAARKENQ